MQTDTFRERLKEEYESGKWVFGMVRKCQQCGELIPIYTESNDAVNGGRPYYADVIDHDCHVELDLNMPPLSSERVTLHVIDRGRGEPHLTLDE